MTLKHNNAILLGDGTIKILIDWNRLNGDWMVNRLIGDWMINQLSGDWMIIRLIGDWMVNQLSDDRDWMINR